MMRPHPAAIEAVLTAMVSSEAPTSYGDRGAVRGPMLTIAATASTIPQGGAASFTITANQAPAKNTSVSFAVEGTAQPGQAPAWPRSLPGSSPGHGGAAVHH